MEGKNYTRKEVLDLMFQAFEQGFKKADVVEAGLEGKETDIECAWILRKYDSIETYREEITQKYPAFPEVISSLPPAVPPYISDYFIIEPDGEFGHDNISDWDDTLMDGLENE